MRSLLAALLLGLVLVLTNAQTTFNGMVVSQGNMIRAQSNANVNMNKQVSRTVQVNLNGDVVAFVTTIINLNVQNTNATLGNTNIPKPNINFQLNQNVVIVAAKPVPYALTRKTSIGFSNSNFAFNSQSQGVAFPAAVEYTEANGMPGFQQNGDTLVQKFDFASLKNNNFSALQVTQEIQPPNVVVHVVQSCNTVNGFCFTFRFANQTYTRNGVNYLPDSVKVDIMANLQNFQNPQDQLAIISAMHYTGDLAQFMDLHAQVDQTVAAANAANAMALVSPDFVAQFNNGNANGVAYLNFARTAQQTDAAGVVTDVPVMAELVPNTQAQTNLQTQFDMNMNANPNFQFMASIQYIVYSVLAPANGAVSLNWDPEIGVADVSTSSMVVNNGLSKGAVAGIVFAVIAVLAVGGFFTYRSFKRVKKAVLLDNTVVRK